MERGEVKGVNTTVWKIGSKIERSRDNIFIFFFFKQKTAYEITR